ncbi:MAG: hypothetical protein GXP25_12320 [Planctomycetes bacterium]|nr:hypothetical protein [Planctomycetota bacterium]
MLILTAGGLCAQPAFTTSFEKGTDRPEGWRQADSPGKWEHGGHTGERSISVTGNGEDHGRWVYAKPPLDPNRTYRFSVWYKSEQKRSGSNSILIGINSSFKRYTHSEKWKQVVLTFRTPANGKDMAVRLGHFHFNGKVWFDDLKIEPVKMVYFERDGVQLGENERIEKGQYIFEPDLNSSNTNCYRVTTEQTVIHHENRMWFRENRYFIHKYQVGSYSQLDAELSMKITQEGQKEKRQPLKCKIEISKDAKQWDVLKQIELPGDFTIPIPKSYFPAKRLFVRLSGDGNFQVKKYRYSAKLDGSPPDMKGRTEALKPNHLIIDNRALRLVIEEGEGPIVSIRQGGKGVGRLECLIAQFEKKGVGYKKTGIDSAPAQRVKSFTLKKDTPGKQVAEVVVERTTSEPAKRKFEAAYRLTVPDNEPWFESKLVSVKNTDDVEYRLIGYYHRLQPAGGIERPKAHAWENLAAWIAQENFLGAFAARPGDFCFGFRAGFGDTTRNVQAPLPPGQTWNSSEPGVILYFGEGVDDAFDRETCRIRRRFGLPGVRRQGATEFRQ